MTPKPSASYTEGILSSGVGRTRDSRRLNTADFESLHASIILSAGSTPEEGDLLLSAPNAAIKSAPHHDAFIL